MIQFTIGPLNGDSIQLQISREGTVRDILMKYVGAFDLSGEKAVSYTHLTLPTTPYV